MSFTALASKMPMHADYNGMKLWNSDLHIQSFSSGATSPSLGSTTAHLGQELSTGLSNAVQLGSSFVALSMTTGAVDLAKKALDIKPQQQPNLAPSLNGPMNGPKFSIN